MKQISILIAAFSFLSVAVFGQCTEQSERKILLIGDSWAAFMHADQTINDAFSMWGHSNYTYISSPTVAENGADTWDFLEPVKQNAIQDILDQNPSIEMVHVSIGGNDVLGDWNVDYTPEQTDSLEEEVKVRLEQIFDFLKAAKPGIRIFWGGYCYTNFEEVIEAIAPAQSIHPFYSTWESMGFPSNQVINGILNGFSDSLEVFVNADPQIDFVKATGLLQYAFGQPTPLGVAPGGTYAPFSVPLPYGDPEYPSPKETMRLYGGIFTDCFHLTPEAYLTLLSYHMQKFYHKFFMDDLYLLSEGGDKDGSVSAAGVVTTSPAFGEISGDKVSMVLSFNTTGMADTTLEAASIFLRRESVTGTNPIELTYPKEVRVINGNFGASAVVEADDFSATGEATDIACRFGSNEGDGHWIRLQLPASILPFINNSGTTQFVINADGVSNGLAVFSDASDPDYAPVLNLNYGPQPSGVNDHVLSENAFLFYPNPTSDVLKFDSKGQKVLSLQLFDVLGQVVLLGDPSVSSLDLSEIKEGSYILSVITENGRFSKLVIKE